MNKSELISVFSGLKGAAAACLLVLQHADEPLSPGELGLITNYTAATIDRGLALLETRQLVVRTVQGVWALPANLHATRQLSGEFSALDPPPENDLAQNFFDAKKIFFASSSYIDQGDLLNLEEEEETANRQKILQLLAAAGIGPNSKKAREIAAAGLDVAYVQAHVQQAQERGNPPGHLITRLLAGDPAPVTTCRCGQCDGCRQRLYSKYPHIQR